MTTYYSHKKRDPLSQFTPQFQAFIKSKPVVAGSRVASSSRASKRRRVGTSDVTTGQTNDLLVNDDGDPADRPDVPLEGSMDDHSAHIDNLSGVCDNGVADTALSAPSTQVQTKKLGKDDDIMKPGSASAPQTACAQEWCESHSRGTKREFKV